MIVLFVGVIDIILMSFFIKKLSFASKSLTKKTKVHQFLKNQNWDLKNLEKQLDIFERKNKPKE